jgi:hypothetical protein
MNEKVDDFRIPNSFVTKREMRKMQEVPKRRPDRRRRPQTADRTQDHDRSTVNAVRAPHSCFALATVHHCWDGDGRAVHHYIEMMADDTTRPIDNVDLCSRYRSDIDQDQSMFNVGVYCYCNKPLADRSTKSVCAADPTLTEDQYIDQDQDQYIKSTLTNTCQCVHLLGRVAANDRRESICAADSIRQEPINGGPND